MIAPHLTERPSKTWVQPLFEVGPDQNMWPGGGYHNTLDLFVVVLSGAEH